MNHQEANNAAHAHYEMACKKIEQADRCTDVPSWRGYLDEAKVYIGLSRLALELRDIPDTR